MYETTEEGTNREGRPRRTRKDNITDKIEHRVM